MNRRNIFKALAATLAVPIVAKAKPVIENKSLLLQDSPLAGFQYYEGDNLWPVLQIGQSLTLQREADNPYDQRAVAVYWNDRKLGYIPRRDNAAISQLLDRDEKLIAVINSLNDTDNPWKRMEVKVSVVEMFH